MVDKEDAAKKILIVEDSEVQLELLRRVLTASGYKVSVARNGAEGLASAREHAPDLIISDILMPVMDGYRLCGELKDDETLKDIPVILLTQLTEPEEVIRGLEAGADNYITKPFENEFLITKVKSQLSFPIRFTNNPGEKCIEFTMHGTRYSVSSSRGQTLNFLLTTYENVVARNLELYRAQVELERFNEQLEEKIKQRTAALAEEMAERKQLGVDLVKRNRELLALTAIYKAAQEKPSLRELLDAALETISGLLELDTGGIYLLEADKKTLLVYSHIGLSEEEVRPFTRLAIGEGAAGLAAAEMKPVVMEAKDYPVEHLAGAITPLRLHTLIGVPILSGNELVGSMSFGSRRPHVFYQDELDLLSAMGKQIGSIVHNAVLYEKLKDSEDKFQSIASAASDAIISISGNGAIHYWNAAAERIFGYSNAEMAGTDISIIVPEKYHGGHKKGLEKFRETGSGDILGKLVEVTAVRKDGIEIPVELAVSGFKFGGVWHAAAVVRDITERKKWAAALEESNTSLQAMVERLEKTREMLIRSEKLAALGALAAGVAHEIKNPLNIISTTVQIMQMEEGLPPKEKEMHVRMMEQINRIVKIIDNLRDYARERKPEVKDIDIVELLRKTVSLVEYEMRAESINVDQRYCAASLSVKGDRDQLAQVFLNLITNARFSMGEKKKAESAERKEGGKVWMGLLGISVEKEDGLAVVKFSDSGMGIPKNALRRIFDPFFTTKPEGRGTGLGLSISLGIIENHHGTIEAESEEGGGAAFTIRLPLG